MSYLPTWEQVLRVLTLSDFNTRVVVVGVGILGMAAGIVGTFTLLRKRALVSDAVSHATLPGIGGGVAGDGGSGRHRQVVSRPADRRRRGRTGSHRGP